MLINDYNKKQMTQSKDIANIMKNVLSIEDDHDQQKEHFWIIGLTARNTIKFIDLVSFGTMTASLVSAKEVYHIILKTKCLQCSFCS